jgi:hypothetical protein
MSLLEKSVQRQIDRLFGGGDPHLAEITKIALLDDGTDAKQREKEYVIQQLKENNKVDSYYIDKEFKLTYDSNGELVHTDNIDEVETDETKDGDYPRRTQHIAIAQCG